MLYKVSWVDAYSFFDYVENGLGVVGGKGYGGLFGRVVADEGVTDGDEEEDAEG